MMILWVGLSYRTENRSNFGFFPIKREVTATNKGAFEISDENNLFGCS